MWIKWLYILSGPSKPSESLNCALFLFLFHIILCSQKSIWNILSQSYLNLPKSSEKRKYAAHFIDKKANSQPRNNSFVELTRKIWGWVRRKMQSQAHAPGGDGGDSLSFHFSPGGRRLLTASLSSLSPSPGPNYSWNSLTFTSTGLCATPLPNTSPRGRPCLSSPINITHLGSTRQGGCREVPTAEVRSRNSCQVIYQAQITINLPIMENRLKERGKWICRIGTVPLTA